MKAIDWIKVGIHIPKRDTSGYLMLISLEKYERFKEDSRLLKRLEKK
jgi:hypothetical protein